MNVYLTGDTHRHFERIACFCLDNRTPLEYAQMTLDGTMEQYLREAAGTHGLEIESC